MQTIQIGSFGGSKVESNKSVTAFQYFNMRDAHRVEANGWGCVGDHILHELREAYTGAKQFPGISAVDADGNDNPSFERLYMAAHQATLTTDPDPFDLAKIEGLDPIKNVKNVGVAVGNQNPVQLFIYNPVSGDVQNAP